MRVGVHVSIAGGLPFAVERAVARGCEAMQIFAGNPRNWRDWEVSSEEAEDFKRARREAGIHPLIVHAPYLVNPASPDGRIRTQSIRSVVRAVRVADIVDADAFVVHSGAAALMSEREAVHLIASFVYMVLEEADPRLKFLLENTAAGAQAASSFDSLASVLSLVGASEEKAGICFDTAHAFAAGYDLRDRSAVDRTLSRIDDVLGIERIGCIHANDTKFILGSGRDRHQHIGEGHIGIGGFEALVKDRRLSGLPFILETPGDEKDDARNVERLKALR